jgi:hypothetical protein
MEQVIYEKIYSLTINKQIKWEGVMDDSYFKAVYKQLYFLYKPVCRTLKVYEYTYSLKNGLIIPQELWYTIEPPLMSINLYAGGKSIPRLELAITTLVEAERQAEKEAEEKRRMQLLVDTFADVDEDCKEEKKETWLDKLKRFFL